MKLASILLVLLLTAAASAQGLASGPSVNLASVPLVTIPRGKPGTVNLRFRVNSGYHINSNTPSAEFMIPTALKMNATTDIVIGRITYPPGKQMAFEFAPDEKLNVYSGDFTVGVLVRPLHSVLPGKYAIRGNLRYQACDNRACYPPKTLPVEFEVKVAKGAPTHSIGRTAQSPHIHR